MDKAARMAEKKKSASRRYIGCRCGMQIMIVSEAPRPLFERAIENCLIKLAEMEASLEDEDEDGDQVLGDVEDEDEDGDFGLEDANCDCMFSVILRIFLVYSMFIVSILLVYTHYIVSLFLFYSRAFGSEREDAPAGAEGSGLGRKRKSLDIFNMWIMRDIHRHRVPIHIQRKR